MAKNKLASQITTTLIAIRQNVGKKNYFQKSICQKYKDILYYILFYILQVIHYGSRYRLVGCNSKVGHGHALVGSDIGHVFYFLTK